MVPETGARGDRGTSDHSKAGKKRLQGNSEKTVTLAAGPDQGKKLTGPARAEPAKLAGPE